MAPRNEVIFLPFWWVPNERAEMNKQRSSERAEMNEQSSSERAQLLLRVIEIENTLGKGCI